MILHAYKLFVYKPGIVLNPCHKIIFWPGFVETFVVHVLHIITVCGRHILVCCQDFQYAQCMSYNIIQITIGQQNANVVQVPDSVFSLKEDKTRYIIYISIYRYCTTVVIAVVIYSCSCDSLFAVRMTRASSQNMSGKFLLQLLNVQYYVHTADEQKSVL